jgi:hypothetical protein
MRIHNPGKSPTSQPKIQQANFKKSVVNRQKFWHLVEEKKIAPNQENEPTHPPTAVSLR